MPTLPSLPLLTDDELAEFFGDDRDGLRRYQLLRALLDQGMTQRQAAEANGVSERTVRNILRAYTRSSSLETLRSRPAAARRRERRIAPAEQALAEALAEDPQAGGDRLWRRAQELLGADGSSLSRRTTYRLLTQLRAERDDDPPDSLRSAVRTALPLLLEDPPLALGTSELAQRFLPAELEPLSRGTLIQQALRTALDYLRPDGPISTIDRNWWPYLICTGEYEAGQSRAELQNDLALSASTYSRAKRQGIDRITAIIPQIIERMVESPVAIASQRLPRSPDFIGRREEQSYYAWRLQTEGLAHIWGVPGSGKTALAAELAAEGHRYGQTILWHTCRAGRDATLLGILRGLAQALAAAGDDQLWREVRQAPADEQDIDDLLATLRDRLLARAAVIVLDDIQRVDVDEMGMLMDAVADLIAHRSTRLLLVGRAAIDGIAYPPLPGLIEREALLLWAGIPPLPAEQWRALYAATTGFPEPLRRVAGAYRRAGDLARPPDWTTEVATWAEEEIWSRLSQDEQWLCAAAYALEAHPWGNQATLVCESLGISIATLEGVRDRALLQIAGAHIALLNALEPHAAALIREDDDLRILIENLAADLQATSSAAPSTAEPAAAQQEAEPLPSPAAPPVGLELLARIRNALEESAEYLQEQPDDQAARQLAVELEVLQAALPDLSSPQPARGQKALTSSTT